MSRVALAVAASSGTGFVLLALFAATGHFLSLDYQVRALFEHAPRPFWDLAMRDVSLMGDDSGLILLIIVVAALLWWRNRHWALALPVLMAGIGAVQFIAKWAVDRPRPNHAAWGFPSGHVMSLVVLFGLVCHVLCRSSVRRCWRYTGTAGCAGIVLMVAFSRLYLQAHWASDVAGGFMLGLAYLLLGIWLVDTMIGGRAWCVIEAAPGPASCAADAPDLAGLVPPRPAAVGE